MALDVLDKELLDKQDISTLIEGFVDWLQVIYHPDYPIDEAEVEEWLCSHFHFSQNGNEISRNSKEFLKFILKTREEYHSLVFSSLLHEPIHCQNRVAIRYNVTAHHRSGVIYEIPTAVIITLDGHHIHRWDSVLSKKSTQEVL